MCCLSLYMTTSNIRIITSAKEGGYVFTFVGLSIFFSVNKNTQKVMDRFSRYLV